MKLVFGFDQFHCPTPKKFRQIGDSFLLMMLALQPMIAGLPISETKMIWISFGFNVIMVMAKFMTNCFGYEPSDDIANKPVQ